MKNKIYLILGMILCISYATSCDYSSITSSNNDNMISSNLDNSNNSSENSSIENNSNINSTNSNEDIPQNSTTNSNGSSNQTVLESEIPMEFYYENAKYTSVSSQNNDLRNRINELLGYLINEEDVENFKEEFPNDNYVVVSYIYSRTYNNRVPFYSVIGYDDYEFIIVKSLTYDLYQKTIDFS